MEKPVSSLVSTNQLYQLLVESVIDYAIYMLTPEGYVNSWNAGAQRIKGYSSEEIIGSHFSTFYTEEDRAAGEPWHALSTAAREGRFETEAWRVRKDGTRFWASVVLDAVRDANGRLVGYAKITRDMSERRKVQEALRESERSFRLLVQGVTDYAIFMLTPEGLVSNWNIGAQRIKGYSEQEIVGSHFSRFYTEEDRSAGEPQRALETALRLGKYEREGWRVRRDGSRFLAHVTLQPMRDDDGVLVGFAKVTRDITERQRAAELLEKTRAHLFQSQKLEALGKLTGGVAHDFNNVLQIIGGNLQLLLPRLEDDPQSRRQAEVALEGVERGAQLSAQLLAFARRQPLKPMVIDLKQLVEGMHALLQRALGETVRIETVVADELWPTLVDPHQLENVILNIAINSRDAMAGEGMLTIELANAVLDRDSLLADPETAAGDYVMLAITDTGNGMSREVMEHALEPFFTTKPAGQGTGLGLSMAYGFTRQSGGVMRIYSEVGLGTSVKIYLPRSDGTATEFPPMRERTVQGGKETVLVVEDDLQVQATAVALLEGLGYRVLRADDAQAALSIVRSGVAIDLLFTDVVMPGPLHSPDLARLARQYQPGIGVLFTSGYTRNAIVHGGRLDPGVELLNKPYRREDLAHKVREVLDNTEQRLRPGAGDAGQVREGPAKYRILLVEDSTDLRTMMCQILEMLGHKVTGAASAEEALTHFAAASFDVLFADISLPGMSGIELAQRALQQSPQLKVIFETGHDEAVLPPLEVAASVLKKPFTIDALRAVLAKL